MRQYKTWINGWVSIVTDNIERYKEMLADKYYAAPVVNYEDDDNKYLREVTAEEEHTADMWSVYHRRGEADVIAIADFYGDSMEQDAKKFASIKNSN